MLRLALACLIGCLAASSALGGKPGFRWLSDPANPANRVIPQAVSADGQVVAGYFDAPGVGGAFRWTSIGGLAVLPDPPTGGTFGDVNDISADGSVIIGSSWEDGGDFPDIHRAVRWTSEKATQLLLGLQTGTAAQISGDGNVILGSTGTSPRLPFRWTEEHGADYLTDLCDGFVNGTLADLDFDGGTIIGTLPDVGRFHGRPYSLSADGCALLDDAAFATVRTAVSDVSADASTIIGGENHGRQNFPFRWSAEDGYQLLSNNSYEIAMDLSADGSIVLGNQFIWSERDGFRTLIQFVTDELGAPARSLGITTLSGVDISGDGRTIVGYGGNLATGRQDGFIFTVPEPSAVALVAIGVICSASTRLWRRTRSKDYHQVRLGSQGQ